MPIDPYGLCPGGTGKKVKFCCSDLVGELEKIGRMLESKQQQACLDHIERLEARYPGRACLLSTKALLQHGLGRHDQARETAQQLLAAQPENPVALAETVLFELPTKGAQASVAPLQRAIDASAAAMDLKVLDAIGAVAVGLLNEGHLAAALAHVMLQLQIAHDHPLAAQLLVSVMQNPAVPLPLKDMPQPLSRAPADVRWRAQFEAAREAAAKAQWARAAERFEALAVVTPRAPQVQRNLGLLYAYLADEPRAAAAWRHYATLDVSLDDAADALVLAYYLDGEAKRTMVELVSVPYTITDQDQLTTRLASDRRAMKLPIEGVEWGDSDEPPPRSAHLLLGKPLAPSGVDLAADAVSEVLGRLFTYGRQTDREARLELVTHRDLLMEAAAVLAPMVGDALGAAGSEEVLGASPLLQRTLGASWHLPADTPPEHARQLASDRRKNALCEKWMTTANDLLDGRTPLSAASEPGRRAALLAALRVVEYSLAEPPSRDESAAMRERLGFAPDEPIEAPHDPMEYVPLSRLARLSVEKLSDDELQHAFERAAFAHVKPALAKFVDEILARPSLEDKVDKAQALGVLAATEHDAGKALELLGMARAAAEAKGRSSAPWDIEELDLLLAHGQPEAALRMVQHLQSQHGREPGVMERVLQLLYDAGIVDEHGRPIQAKRAEPAGLVVPGAAAEPGKLWTPGGETTSGKKATLWTPGMQ
jgi:hypothetical protein